MLARFTDAYMRHWGGGGGDWVNIEFVMDMMEYVLIVWLTDGRLCMYASVSLVIIGLYNGMWHIRHRAITWTNADLCQFDI